MSKARGENRSFAGRTLATLVGFVGLFVFEAPRASADEIEWMFEPNAVVEMNIGDISEAELDELEATPDEYVKGTFELKVDGVTKGVPLTDVGVRLKGGFGSARPIKTGKSGLKIRFDEFVDDQLFFGIKRLTLNNMVQDESMVHETLTYELFHAMDLPASRTGYAFINLNGQKYGTFLNIETLDEVSLPRWFPNTQHLYEADVSEVDLTPGSAPLFEVDEGDDEDLTDLEALIETIHDEDGDWSDNVEAVADLGQMTENWAVERYVGHWDGYAGAADVPNRPNNYYLHSTEDGIFQMVPWGTDQTWEFFKLGFEFRPAGAMFNKCLEDATCRKLYIEGLTKVHCVAPGLDQGAHATQLAAMLAPYQAEEDATKRGYTAEQIADEVENVESFVTERAERLVKYLTEQEVLGAGKDPCATPADPDPDPEPEKPTPEQPPTGGGSPPASDSAPLLKPLNLKIGPSRAAGQFVVTRLDVPAAGKATQRVTARLGGAQTKVCSGQSSRASAGPLTVRCRLSGPARAALADGPLKLQVRVGFVSPGGVQQVDQRITVPERG
jgi:CotH kinase protein